MEGDVETIRALLKGETGEGCKTAGALLSVGKEEITLVLLILGESLVLFVATVEVREGETGSFFLMLVKCVGEAVTVLSILGDELEELVW